MNSAPGRSRDSSASSTRPRVSGVRATCTLRTSDRVATSPGVGAISTRDGPVRSSPLPSRPAADSSSKRRDQMTRCIPKAWARTRQFTGHVTEPEQSERPTLEPARLREPLLVPVAGPQLGDVVGDPPVERQDEPERELGDRDRVPAGQFEV